MKETDLKKKLSRDTVLIITHKCIMYTYLKHKAGLDALNIFNP